MSSLICGSIAFDTIMTFPGRFRDHILPEQIHILNVAFLVPGMRREYGGCAGNIAYNLKLLGGDPVPMATVGTDAKSYLDRFAALGISTAHLTVIDGSYTAQAMITTDLDNNQITAFHPGAMFESHRNDIAAAGPVALGIIAPDGRDGILLHAQQLLAAGIPFVFDPGQSMPVFSGEELLQLIGQASYLAVNDYEAQLLATKTGVPIDALAQQVDALLVTRGEHGVDIYADGDTLHIPAVVPDAVVDPTGCGDAFRAGLLFGIENGLDWETTGRLANLMGSIKIAHEGPQNHAPSRDEIAQRYARAFGTPITL